MFCRHCGTANQEGTAKCTKCGTDLPVRPAARMETTVFDSPAQPTSVLPPSENTGQGFQPNPGPAPSNPFNQPQNPSPSQFAPMPNPAPVFSDPYASPYSNTQSTNQTNTLSIVSLVAGILGIISCWCWGIGFIPGVVGLVAGYMAMNQIKLSGGRGREMALAGMITGGIGLALSVIDIILIIIGYSGKLIR